LGKTAADLGEGCSVILFAGRMRRITVGKNTAAKSLRRIKRGIFRTERNLRSSAKERKKCKGRERKRG